MRRGLAIKKEISIKIDESLIELYEKLADILEISLDNLIEKNLQNDMKWAIFVIKDKCFLDFESIMEIKKLSNKQINQLKKFETLNIYQTPDQVI